MQVAGLAALVTVTGATAGSDRVTVNALAGDDVVDASGARRQRGAAHRTTAARATTSCSAATATTRCSAATATTSCSAAPATTSSTAGPGDNVVIQSIASGQSFLASHARVVNGQTVLKVDGKDRALPSI